MNVVIFFLIAVSILAIGYGFLGWRLIATSNLSEPWNLISWIALVVFFLIPLVFFLLMVNRVENEFTDFFSWVGYLGMGLVSMLFTLVLFRDIVLLTSAGIEKLVMWGRDFFQAGAQAAVDADPGRRQFLVMASNAVVLGAGGLLTGYGLYEARRTPALVEILVPIKDLPPDLEGFRILQITDIHAGLTVKRPFVEMVAEQAEGVQADLIAFTGDLADGSVKYLHEHVEPLKHLSAPHGQYFITGNHEYYSGVEPWIEEADRLGFTVLLNEHRLIQRGAGRILLSGVTDYSAGDFLPSQKSDPAAAVAGAPAGDVRILLAHQPRSLYAALPLGFDLQISGHTHGGQFFPWNILAAAGQPYIADRKSVV